MGGARLPTATTAAQAEALKERGNSLLKDGKLQVDVCHDAIIYGCCSRLCRPFIVSQAALGCYREAVEAYEEMRDEDNHGSALAVCLSNRALVLCKLNRAEEAAAGMPYCVSQ